MVSYWRCLVGSLGRLIRGIRVEGRRTRLCDMRQGARVRYRARRPAQMAEGNSSGCPLLAKMSICRARIRPASYAYPTGTEVPVVAIVIESHGRVLVLLAQAIRLMVVSGCGRGRVAKLAVVAVATLRWRWRTLLLDGQSSRSVRVVSASREELAWWLWIHGCPLPRCAVLSNGPIIAEVGGRVGWIW